MHSKSPIEWNLCGGDTGVDEAEDVIVYAKKSVRRRAKRTWDGIRLYVDKVTGKDCGAKANDDGCEWPGARRDRH